jgi:hypothetical protein
MSRLTLSVLTLIQNALTVSGIVLIVGLFGLSSGQTAFIDGLKSFLPESNTALAEVAEDEVLEAPTEALNPRMRGALEYVAKRYRVSNDALLPVFATAQAAGRDLKLDPLLIIAVIGVESGFNPLSQSVVGAQGLMQVLPRFHKDKLPSDAGELPFFDPMTNVQVGAKVLKESIPVQVGEYVIARGIADEPAFAWWVPYVMRKHDAIVSAVKSFVMKTTHKYGIEMPAPGRDVVKHAQELDQKNGNTFWMDALAKEMTKLCVWP